MPPRRPRRQTARPPRTPGRPVSLRRVAAERSIPDHYLQQVPGLTPEIAQLTDAQLRVSAIRVAKRALESSARRARGDIRLLDGDAIRALVAAAEGRVGAVPEAE